MADLISYGFLAPPTVLIVISALAAWWTLWHPRPGIALVIVATSLLFLASIPGLSALMLQQEEMEFPLKPNFAAAQAIVVLGAGIRVGDGDRIPDTLSALSVQRLDFAARAYRQLHLRIAVTGGKVHGSHATEASLMKAALQDDFALPVTWTEDQSRTTFENAAFTARLLKAEGVSTVVVVTHAWHMKRALWSFEHVGLHALPWPAPATADATNTLDDFLPNVAALQGSFLALHEALGLIYYRLRY